MKMIAGDRFQEKAGAIMPGIWWQGWKCEKCGHHESTFEKEFIRKRDCPNGCDGENLKSEMGNLKENGGERGNGGEQ